MEFVWVDLQHQPEGADVWMSFQGNGMLQCYLIPSPQFSAFAKGDAVDCFQFAVAPPQHAVQIPREGLWHLVMRGVGEAEVRVTPQARLDQNVRAILQPEKHQDPTPDPRAPDLTQLPLHTGTGPAVNNPLLPSGQAGWSKLLVPSVGMDQKRLEFLRRNFFLDNVYPMSVSTSRNAVGNVITAQMSDGSTFEQWIADAGPTMPGLPSSTPVLSPEQRISMARVQNSPLFGDSKLMPDGTIEPENPWYLDLLDALDMASWIALVVPVADLAGLAGKALISVTRAFVGRAVKSGLERGAKAAAIKAEAESAAKTAESVMDKLNRYLLDPENTKGGAEKAKWFREALGFTKENAGDLGKQIIFDESIAWLTEVGPHGPKYNQIIPITGANGRTIDVRFAFIRNDDGVVRLVTAIPTRKRK